MISQTDRGGSGAGGSLTGSGCASDGQRLVNGGFGGAAGVTIASGAGEGRLIAIGGERLREDAAWGLSKFHAFPVRKLTGRRPSAAA